MRIWTTFLSSHEQRRLAVDKGVIYARYSSHNQREESIEQQVAECRAFAARENIEVVEVYADKAVSGRSDRRTAFQKMLRDADLKKFEVVIAYKSNRIARNMLNALQYEARLDALGIKTLYVKEEFGNTATGRFALRMMMNINQFYSENMAEDIKRGMKDNAENCKVNGSVAYGYRKGSDGRYELDPVSAPVAREIFERIASGERLTDIANDLNARGIRTKYGNPWKVSSFDRMLRNKSYIGVYHNSGIEVPGGMPSIISEEVWEKVQKIKDGTLPQQAATDYLLTGRLFCGECGSPMVGVSGTSRNGEKHFYYSCNGHRLADCPKKNERKEQLEETVVRLTQENILTDEFIEELADAVFEMQTKASESMHLEDHKKHRADIQRRIGNLTEAIEEGIRTKTTLDRLRDLESELVEVDRHIAEIAAFRPVERDKVVFTLSKLKDGSYTDKNYQRLLIRSFVRSVTVFDDHLKVDYILPSGGSYPHNCPPPNIAGTNHDVRWAIGSNLLTAVLPLLRP